MCIRDSVYDAEGNKHSVLYTLTAMTNTLPPMPVMQSADAASATAVNGQKVINYCGNIIYDGDETMVPVSYTHLTVYFLYFCTRNNGKNVIYIKAI